MPFDHNDDYHRLLPRGCRTALDVGCGTGRRYDPAGAGRSVRRQVSQSGLWQARR